jgi:hypothetical protein
MRGKGGESLNVREIRSVKSYGKHNYCYHEISLCIQYSTISWYVSKERINAPLLIKQKERRL